MNEVKSWITSKVIWSALVALVPTLSGLLGFDMGATLEDVLTIAGIVGAIVFRIMATARLK